LAAYDEESVFGTPKPKPAAHVVGEPLDAMSERELSERIELLRSEIERLEAAMSARRATREAAASFFKS